MRDLTKLQPSDESLSMGDVVRKIISCENTSTGVDNNSISAVETLKANKDAIIAAFQADKIDQPTIDDTAALTRLPQAFDDYIAKLEQIQQDSKDFIKTLQGIEVQ